MNHMTYHKATIDDISTLVENRVLFGLELSGEQKEETIRLVKNHMAVYFLKAITENTCISFIAKCDALVAGIGSMHIREMPGHFKNPTGRWGYIMNMYTIPVFRRKGICKNILELLLNEGEKLGITAFELHATKEGEFVYSQNGFEVHGDRTYRKFIGNIN